MAQFDIDVERLSDPGLWPDRCARCGRTGTKLVPVPARFAKKSDGLTIPLCSAHGDDWAQVGFRTRIGAIAILLGMTAAAIATWELQPKVAGPINRNDSGRITATVMLGFLSALPIGLLAASWAKTPIRVLDHVGRLVTVGGVCKNFAASISERPPPPLPEVPETFRFEVHEYRPAGIVAPELAMRLFGIVFTIAALLGLAIGFGGSEIGQATLGWDDNDWRYLFMSAGLAVAYVFPLLGFKLLSSRFGRIILLLAAGGAALGMLMFRFFGAPQSIGFGILFAGGALLVLEFVGVHRLIMQWRIRSVPVAVCAGFLSPLVLTGCTYLLVGDTPGPHQVMYVLGPIAALFSASFNRAAARAPYCTECDAWLERRRIGALPRTLGEVKPVIETGEIVALASIKQYEESAIIGDVELWVDFCDACRERGTVVLELYDCVKGGKNGKVPTLVKTGRWLYPGSALLVVEEVFALSKRPVDENPPDPTA